MARQVQFRRGTTAQTNSFTGAVGEVTVNTDKDTVVVHDGSTAGGHPLPTSLADLGVTSSAAELNTLDGIPATLTATELGYVDGVTSSIQTQLDAKGTVSSLSDLSITSTATELNTLDGIPATLTATELGYVDGVTSAIQTQLDAKQALDAELTELATMASTTASALADLTQAEVQILDGATVSTAELNYVTGVTSSIQTQLDAKGTVSSLSDLGVTASSAELNYVDITTLGTSQASKAVTADANGVVTFDNGKIEESTAITSSSNAATLNLRDGDNFTHTLSENVTYTFSNPAASGKVSAFTLKVIQDSSARAITWPASVDWAASTAPTLSTGSGNVDVFVFATYDGGTTYYGFTAGQAMG